MTPCRSFVSRCLVPVLVFVFWATAGAADLKVVCDEWPPYQIVENDAVTGFSTEIVTAVFASAGLSIEGIKAYPWKRALYMLEKGEADALFSANRTPEREVVFRYPDESLFDSPWVFWAREDGKGFRSLEDLKGRKVGVVNGYSYTPEFWAFLNQNGVADVANSDEQNFRKLEARRVDYVAAELGNGYHLLHQLKFKGIVPILDHPIKTDGLYVAFNPRGVPAETVARFGRELQAFKRSPAYEALRQKYLSSE